MERLRQCEKAVIELEARRKLLSEQKEGIEGQLVEHKDRAQQVILPVVSILQAAIEAAVNQGQHLFTSYLTKGFQDVFGEGYSIDITERGETAKSRSAYIYETRADGTSGDIAKSSGSSSMNLAALLSRILTVHAWRDRLAQVVVADEDCSNFNDESMPHVLNMLREICSAIGMQVIIVSHAGGVDECADNLIQVGKEGGSSFVCQS